MSDRARKPSPHGRPVDLESVRADEALLDTLGRGGRVPGDDELAGMLGAWRAEMDTEPLPNLDYSALPMPGQVAGEAPDTALGDGTATGRVVRRRFALRPRNLRLAVAAALVVATAGGVSVAAAGARPDSPLWPVVRVVNPRLADVRAAEDAIAKARLAADEHRYADARRLVDEATALVAKVRDPGQARRLRDELDAVRRSLPGATPGVLPGTGRTPTPGAPTPSAAPAPGAGATPGPGASAPATPNPTGAPGLPLPLPSLPLPLPSLPLPLPLPLPSLLGGL